MKYRFWNLDKDYTILEEWCKERNWESSIPKEMLPPQGIIIEDKDPICALGLYLNEKVKFGYMYGIFSNPSTPKIKLFKAMKLCFNGIKLIANELNLKYLYTTTAEKSLSKLYSKFLKLNNCESNLKAYIINLNNLNANLDWISEKKEIKNGNR